MEIRKITLDDIDRVFERLNELIHRDYSSNTEGAYIYLRIFDDRIEILNPEDLYGNNILENLGTDNMLEVRIILL